MPEKVIIQTTIHAPIATVWECYTAPEHIVNWNHASDDWHTTSARNDLQVGGTFVSRMEAKDGSTGFDFGGTYTTVEDNRLIAYTMEDGREVEIKFDGEAENTNMQIAFDPENENTIEMQREGWMAILTNFQEYTEKLVAAQLSATI